MRITRAVERKARKKKMMQFAKGFSNRRKNCYQIAIDKIAKKFQYQYVSRKNLKRDMRSLWILRINNGLRLLGFKYSQFINKLKNSDILLNRKSLAELAARQFESFKAIVIHVMGPIAS